MSSRVNEIDEELENVIVDGVSMVRSIKRVGELETDETSSGDMFVKKLKATIENADSVEDQSEVAIVGRYVGALMGHQKLVKMCDDVLNEVGEMEDGI